MRKEGERLFQQNESRLLSNAASLFGFENNSLKKLGSFESMVYEFTRNNAQYILKLTHDSHRSLNQIRGELEWTNYLGDNGVRVPRAIPSITGSFVEPLNGGSSEFFTYAYEKSPGHHLTEEDWNDNLYFKWGEITGRMHALTKKYRPSENAIRRPSWFDDGYFKWVDSPEAESFEPDFLAACRRNIEAYRGLPTDPGAYGLIHSDLHLGNLFVHEGEIIAFDFDDCRYDWFSHDLAIPLVYSLQDTKFGVKDIDFITRFFRKFMEGYYKENDIDSFWLSKIPIFLKTREIDLYFIIKNEEIEDSNDWCRRFMKNRKEKIANDEPVIDLDFASLV
ncbi:MAG: phosphotransferase [Candidatus Zixiibacteriota bacterium]